MNQELFEQLKKTLGKFEWINHVKFRAGNSGEQNKKPVCLEFELNKFTDELRVMKVYGAISAAINRNFPGLGIEYAAPTGRENYNPLIRTITFSVKDSSALPCQGQELIEKVAKYSHDLIKRHL